MEAFHVSKEEEKRIVFVTNMPASKSKWGKELMAAVQQYQRGLTSVNKTQRNYVRKKVLVDLTEQVEWLNGHLMDTDASDTLKEKTRQKYMETFAKEQKSICAKYKKSLDKAMGQMRIKSKQQLDALQKEDASFFDKVGAAIKAFGENLFGVSLAEIKKHKKMLQGVLIDNQESLLGRGGDQALQDVRDKLFEKLRQLYPDTGVLPEISAESEVTSAPVKIDEKIATDSIVLLKGKGLEQTSITGDNFDKIMKTTAYLSMLYWCSGVKSGIEKNAVDFGKVGEDGQEIVVAQIPSTEETCAEVRKTITGTVSALGFAVDVQDGRWDLPASLAASLATPEGAMIATSIGLASVAYWIASFQKECNVKSIRQYQRDCDIIDSLYQEAAEAYYNEATEFCQDVEQNVRQSLGEYLGIGQDSTDDINALHSLMLIRDDLREMRKGLKTE